MKMKTRYPDHGLIKDLSAKHLAVTITDSERVDLINHLREAYLEARAPKELESLIDTCESCIQRLGCKMSCDVREQLRNHIKCSEITMRGKNEKISDLTGALRDCLRQLQRAINGETMSGDWLAAELHGRLTLND